MRNGIPGVSVAHRTARKIGSGGGGGRRPRPAAPDRDTLSFGVGWATIAVVMFVLSLALVTCSDLPEDGDYSRLRSASAQSGQEATRWPARTY